jgi:hypothetical protein
MNKMEDIAYKDLKETMSKNRCGQEDFERVRNIRPSVQYNSFQRLENYMILTKLCASATALTAGYYLGNILAENFTENNLFPKILGGLTAFLAAKAIAKPAARAGLDLGLRINK